MTELKSVYVQDTSARPGLTHYNNIDRYLNPTCAQPSSESYNLNPTPISCAHLQVVTDDAREGAGSAPGCVNNTRTGIGRIFDLVKTLDGQETVQRALRLCERVDEGDGEKIGFWIQASNACD